MKYITFGKTDLSVSRTGFGCIPIQRIPYDESTVLLRHAYDNGVTLYDTANSYTTSEDRIGTALSDVRQNIVICTKSGASNPTDYNAHLDNSLEKLRTDYIDVQQFHMPPFVPRPGGEDGLYDVALAAKTAGKIRFIGFTAHKLNLAVEAVESGLYDTIQYPFSYLSTDEEMDLTELCKQHNVGVLGMKAMCGGILTNAKAAFAFLRNYDNIVPIWGMQKISELEEFLRYEESEPKLTQELLAEIEVDRNELSSAFCRACGYCLPCPAGIPIPMACRMKYLLGRMRVDNLLTPAWEENMRKISDCSNCGHCKAHCPYELNVPELLKKHQQFFYEAYNQA